MSEGETAIEEVTDQVNNIRVSPEKQPDIRGEKRLRETDDNQDHPSKKDKKRVPEKLEKSFKLLRGISEKTARYQAHLSFLGKYLKEGKVPKGLLWSTKPSFGRTNEPFLKKWNDFQHRSSLHLLDLTIELLQSEVEGLLAKGATAKENLYSQADTPEQADDIISFIKEIVDKRIDFINKTKQKKLEADLAGRPRGNARPWTGQQRPGQSRPNRQQPSNQRQLTRLVQMLLNLRQ